MHAMPKEDVTWKVNNAHAQHQQMELIAQLHQMLVVVVVMACVMALMLLLFVSAPFHTLALIVIFTHPKKITVIIN